MWCIQWRIWHLVHSALLILWDGFRSHQDLLKSNWLPPRSLQIVAEHLPLLPGDIADHEGWWQVTIRHMSQTDWHVVLGSLSYDGLQEMIFREEDVAVVLKFLCLASLTQVNPKHILLKGRSTWRYDKQKFALHHRPFLDCDLIAYLHWKGWSLSPDSTAFTPLVSCFDRSCFCLPTFLSIFSAYLCAFEMGHIQFSTPGIMKL